MSDKARLSQVDIDTIIAHDGSMSIVLSLPVSIQNEVWLKAILEMEGSVVVTIEPEGAKP